MGEAKRRRLAGDYPKGRAIVIPDDIKRDIAKAVRCIEWVSPDIGGRCLQRAYTGLTVLTMLKIPVRFALGGMIYRCGPDKYRDVVAFCGNGNVGTVFEGKHFLGHYWLMSGNDIVDFNVGDWRQNSDTLPDVRLPGMPELGEAQWTAPPLPDFHWADRSEFTPTTARTPDLGRAWYTGFRGDDPIGIMRTVTKDMEPHLREIVPHIKKAFEWYALKERLFAVRNGHTAVQASQLCATIGAKYEGKADRLIVLRGKVDVTPETAGKILDEAGFSASVRISRDAELKEARA